MLLKKAFSFLLLTAILNWLADKLYLYWTIWWMDMLVHFLGGLSIVFFVFWVYSKYKNLNNYSNKKVLFIIAIFFAFVVGVFWEIFELYFGIS